MEQQQALLPKTIIDARYEVLAVAGEGGMGTVYRARHLQLDRIVAIKLLREDLAMDADAVRRFKAEAQLARNLNHPNICQVQAFGLHDGRPFIVFDFLAGCNLQEVLQNVGTLPVDRFINIFSQVCLGLAHAHANGVIHRDLKPANVFLLAEGTEHERVQIVDFGIAKEIEGKGTAAQRLTETGTLLGTPLYMSPEQGRAEKLSYATDIYSLGCVMYHACFGHSPFQGESAYEILFGHSYKDVVLDTVPNGYPPGILAVLGSALAKEPEKRYAGAEDLRLALLGMKVAKPNSIKLRPQKPKKATIAVKAAFPLSVLAIACAVSAVGLLVFWLAGGATTSRDAVVVGWHETKDMELLRTRLGKLFAGNPQEAIDVVRVDLRDDLLTSPSPTSAAIFFDTAQRAATLPGEIRTGLFHHGMLVLRLLPASAWNSPDANLDQLLQEWARSNGHRQGDTAKAYLQLIMVTAVEGNLAMARHATGLAVAELRRQSEISPGLRDLIIKDADVLAEHGQKTLALELLQSREDPKLPRAYFQSQCAAAKIHDACGDAEHGGAAWQKAYETATKFPHDCDVSERTDALQGWADDQLQAGDKSGAERNYGAVTQLVYTAASSPGRWVQLLRLGDGYSVLGKPESAGKVFQFGQFVCGVGLNEPAIKEDAGNSALAYAYTAQNLSNFGKPLEALAFNQKAIERGSGLRGPQKQELNRLVDRSRPMLDQIACIQRMSTVQAQQKAQLQRQESQARQETIAAQWYFLRGNLAASASHNAAAATTRARITGNQAVGSAMLAMKDYFRVKDFSHARQWADYSLNANLPKPEHNATELIWAQATCGLGDYASGRQKFSHRVYQDWVRQHNPHCIPAYLSFGQCEAALNDPEKAIDDYTNAYNFAVRHQLTGSGEFRQAALDRIRLQMKLKKSQAAANYIQDFIRDTRPQSEQPLRLKLLF